MYVELFQFKELELTQKNLK